MGSEKHGALPNNTNNSFNEKFQRLKRNYDKAYSHINQAHTLDDQMKANEAIDGYVRAIRYMNSAIGLWSELCREYPKESQLSDMGKKMEKLTVNLTKARQRVDALSEFLKSASSCNQVVGHSDPPPSYNATLAKENCQRKRAGAEAGGAMTDATLLFLIDGGVQIYFVSGDGTVSAPSYPSSLAVYRFVDGAACRRTADSPPAFLQVGDWIYPLVPSISPVLHASWGAYVFPDVTARAPGCYVGVILPDAPDSTRRQQLEQILKTYTTFKEQTAATEPTGQTAPSPGTTDTTISKGITSASEWFSRGVTKGAEKAGQWVKSGSEKLRQHMEPQSEPSKIDPRVQKGAQRAREVTGGAVKITSQMIDKVGLATSSLAKTMSPHVQRTSDVLLPNSWTSKNSSDGRSATGKVSEVAGSGLKGFSTVYLGLEKSAMILAKSVAGQTVQTVQYKYGEEAGQLTGDVVHSVSNVAVVAGSMNRFGAQVVARQVAKETSAETDPPAQHSNDSKPSGGGKNTTVAYDDKKLGGNPDKAKESQAGFSHKNSQCHSAVQKPPHDVKKGRPPT